MSVIGLGAGEVGRLLPCNNPKIKPADFPKGINANLVLGNRFAWAVNLLAFSLNLKITSINASSQLTDAVIV